MMTKIELYVKLMRIYENHCVKNTLTTTLVDNVINVVYEYLKEKVVTQKEGEEDEM